MLALYDMLSPWIPQVKPSIRIRTDIALLHQPIANWVNILNSNLRNKYKKRLIKYLIVSDYTIYRSENSYRISAHFSFKHTVYLCFVFKFRTHCVFLWEMFHVWLSALLIGCDWYSSYRSEGCKVEVRKENILIHFKKKILLVI